MTMTRDEAAAFARRWSDAWNRLEIESVLEHFDDQVVFSSPKALEAIGIASVVGKSALRAYWMAALTKITSLHFSVVRVVWDAETRELAIIYDRQVNGRRDRASENLQFAESGLVVRGEVFYGVV
jgi:hypothetical protein